MKPVLALVLLVLCATTLPAVVAGGSGAPRLPDRGEDGEGRLLAKAPAWVTDPTEGGKRKAAVASWAAGASKDEQRKARDDATATIIATFKLPASAKVKEMNMWVDPQGKTYVQLVAR